MTQGLVRRFSELVALFERGRLEASMDEAVREALEVLKAQPGERGTATVTLSIGITFEKGMVNLRPKLVVKLPEGAAFAPLVLWEHEGALSLQHPSQHDMFAAVKQKGDEAHG